MSVASVRTPNCKCKTCGKNFWIRESKIRSGRGIYCSRKCHHFKTPEERFWDKVDKSGECWVWQSTIGSSGYGWIGINRKMVAAHRYSWEMHNGPIPSNLCVLHKCDNPPCVNPSHLFLGTNLDNSNDKIAKKRNRTGCHRGEVNAHSKLTTSQVIAMKALRSSKKLTYQALGKMFGVTLSTAHLICTGRSWKHIP